MIRLVMIALALLLAGCASGADLVTALAKDNASACVGVKAALYGHVFVGRANAAGSSRVVVSPEGCSIEHVGGGK